MAQTDEELQTELNVSYTSNIAPTVQEAIDFVKNSDDTANFIMVAGIVIRVDTIVSLIKNSKKMSLLGG
ncbi:MAG: hypothetical protein GQ540_03695 [Lutibacter sp.]|uniref:hypothetical protein n=1 Tax=Lutibacter sp. TaxID=1925666 RepID=UPI001A0E228D|nr:hypothetical protein [Lutibacter sp.]NOR27616.1 hypothetical protein [Lutibacter sp.]